MRPDSRSPNPSALTTTEHGRERYFDAAQHAALEALARGSEVRRSFRIAGVPVSLRFASPSLADAFSPALSHLVVPEGEPVDLSVCAWDSRSTGVAMPPPPWEPEDYLARGDIRGWSSDVRAAYKLGVGTLSLFDPARSAAVFWVADSASLPDWERAAPFRTILGWFLRSRACELLHAGAVGERAGGVLLTGRGGRGKSTVALSCAAAEGPLRYAGDDYVAVQLTPQPRVYSVYNSGKLDLAHARSLLPELAPLVTRQPGDAEEKGLLFVQQHLPERVVTDFALRALLLPAIGATAEPGTPVLQPVSPLQILQELAPTTLSQMPGTDQQTFRFLASLVSVLPCYQLALGSGLAAARDAIAGLLAKTS
jgi:hypothetical protein